MEGVCIVTGAARGIGAAIARAAAHHGYGVCINYLASEDAAQALRASIESIGGRAIAYRADVSKPAEVLSLFETVDRELGSVTALVNNAAISGGRHRLSEIESDAFRGIVDVNLLGTFLCIKEAVRRMAFSRGGKGGAIVNLSSTAVRTGGRHLAAYVAAKAGVEGLTRALGVELGGEGIRVNAIAPGLIGTVQEQQDAEALEQRVSSIPLGRLGTTDEVAQAALWFLSKEAAYVTGTVLDVAGGR